MIYAGIGSRETPIEIQDRMYSIAVYLAEQGWTLRSGHAEGADKAFEFGAKYASGKMEIYLPWNDFNGAQVHEGINSYIVPLFGEEAVSLAGSFHPNWGACKMGARKLHTRNVYQILGQDLNTPVSMVICWTKDGKREGGTGQALRIAEHHHISIFDLALPLASKNLETWINLLKGKNKPCTP